MPGTTSRLASFKFKTLRQGRDAPGPLKGVWVQRSKQNSLRNLAFAQQSLVKKQLLLSRYTVFTLIYIILHFDAEGYYI
jgi:hypothetical protein